MPRTARLIVEPLTDWPHPDVATTSSPFEAPWTATRDELLREADHLGATQVVLEVDCSRRQLRQDGQLRADARLHSGRVRVSMDTRHGPMRWALARYDDAGLSWQANVRGIVLTLTSLRAVDRYGAVADGQQYRGFLAIEAGPTKRPEGGWDLADPDGARAWLVRMASATGQESTGTLLRRVRGMVDESTPETAGHLAQVECTLTGAGTAS